MLKQVSSWYNISLSHSFHLKMLTFLAWFEDSHNLFCSLWGTPFFTLLCGCWLFWRGFPFSLSSLVTSSNGRWKTCPFGGLSCFLRLFLKCLGNQRCVLSPGSFSPVSRLLWQFNLVDFLFNKYQRLTGYFGWVVASNKKNFYLPHL